jgi:glycosyltransferase involved in cell wall biosynthesis
MKDAPLVTIIVPTYNSAKTLERCLVSVRQQTYPNIEVVLVDGGSTDDTVSIAARLNAQVHICSGMGMTEATNHGIRHSRGRYLYRIDSDVVLDSTLVEECVATCTKKGADALCIVWTPDPTISFWAKVRKLENDCYANNPFPRGARFFPREVILSIGCFDPELVSGEDYDVYNKLVRRGFRLGTVESRETHIGEPQRLVDVFRKQYAYGITLKAFFRASQGVGVAQMWPFRSALLKNWKAFARHPALSVGFVIYELICYAAAILGLVVSVIEGDKNRSQSERL